MSFNAQSPPVRGGDYTRFEPVGTTRLPSSTGATVLVPFTDKWGPSKTFVELNQWTDYLTTYENTLSGSAHSEGFVGVYNAFRGRSNANPGAGRVLGYRIGGSALAKATKTVTGLSGASITAKYDGTLGNAITYDVVANATNPSTQVDFIIYLNGAKKEEYRGYAAGAGQAALAAKMASDSKLVTYPGAPTSGSTLPTLGTNQQLVGGNDGLTLAPSDWTALMAAAEPQNFGHFAPANLTDTSVASAVAAWTAGLNAAARSKRFSAWLGGLAGESYATASAAAAGFNDENVNRVGIGTYRDTALGLNLTTGQLAPRIAGIQAGYGGSRGLAFSYLDDLEIVAGPTNYEIEQSLINGVIVLVLGTAGVKIENGVTTYVTKNNPAKPFDTYSKIKYVATMQNFERERREANEDGTFLGAVNNNAGTRETLIAREQEALDKYIEAGEVQPGALVVLSSNPAPDDDATFAAVDWYGSFARNLDQIRRTVIFG